MSLIRSRRFMSVLLIAMISAGGCMFFAVQLVHCTLCSEAFVSRYFCSKEITQICKSNYDARIEALEARSAIPKRVFEAGYSEAVLTEDSSLHRLFSGRSSELDDDIYVKRFEELCKEYFDGTGQKYNKKLIHNTALEATRIYSDCFGIDDTTQFTEFLKHEMSGYARNTSLSMMITIVPIVIICVLYKKSYDIMLRIFSAFTATGFAMMITSVSLLIINSRSLPDITPVFYAEAVQNTVQGALIVALLTGAVVGIGALIANIIITDKIKNTPSDTL